MNTMTKVRWRLEELVQHSQHLLAQLPENQGDSRRVRWNPTPRLVRYYTTLGLLDRPTEMRGRTAYYSERHLLQLLAIKVLQVRGVSLEKIQCTLSGKSNKTLAAGTGLAPDWADGLNTVTSPTISTVAAPSAENFWQRSPAPVSTTTSAATPTPQLSTVTSLLSLTLSPSLQLLIDPRHYPDLDQAALTQSIPALRAALSSILHAAAHSHQENHNDNANPSDSDE